MQKLLSPLLCLILALTGCTFGGYDRRGIDLGDYDMLRDTYVHPLFTSGILAAQWDDAGELDPDLLVQFYSAYAREREDAGSDWNLHIPPAQLEEYVQRYFDVNTDHLRQSGFYDDGEGVYRLARRTWVEDSETDIQVTSTWRDGDRIDLDVQLLRGSPTASAFQVSIQLLPQGFRYTGCTPLVG